MFAFLFGLWPGAEVTDLQLEHSELGRTSVYGWVSCYPAISERTRTQLFHCWMCYSQVVLVRRAIVHFDSADAIVTMPTQATTSNTGMNDWKTSLVRDRTTVTIVYHSVALTFNVFKSMPLL